MWEAKSFVILRAARTWGRGYRLCAEPLAGGVGAPTRLPLGLTRRCWPLGDSPQSASSTPLIHSVQLRPLLGQPHQFDAEFHRQAQRLGIGVRGCPVQQEPDRAGLSVSPSQLREKGPCIRSARTLPAHYRAMAALDIHGPEQHAFGMASRDGHAGLFTHA